MMLQRTQSRVVLPPQRTWTPMSGLHRTAYMRRAHLTSQDHTGGSSTHDDLFFRLAYSRWLPQVFFERRVDSAVVPDRFLRRREKNTNDTMGCIRDDTVVWSPPSYASRYFASSWLPGEAMMNFPTRRSGTVLLFLCVSKSTGH